MGASGHVYIGLAFLIIGLWHLFNSIKRHCLHPNSYSTLPWFPVSSARLRRSEPITIMSVTAAFISSELFISWRHISPGDDGIPSVILPHLEHSIIALSFFVYSLFALLLDRLNIDPPAGKASNYHGLAHFVMALAFGQQLIILHLHSTDHMGVEGQYHWLLQIVTFVSLITTLLAIGYPGSFVNSFVRAFSVVFQGVWLIVSGVMLWTPGLVPNGCFLKPEVGHVAVLCHGDGALDRAKALVNIQFGLYLIVLTVSSMSLYLVMVTYYNTRERVGYTPLTKTEAEGQDIDEVVCKVGLKSTSRTNSVPI